MNNTELSHDKIQAEIAKLIAEGHKLSAETAKINSENRYYVIVVTASATLAVIAFVKLFI